jgi:tetratricopeptide (TPR) repeat protein
MRDLHTPSEPPFRHPEIIVVFAMALIFASLAAGCSIFYDGRETKDSIRLSALESAGFDIEKMALLSDSLGKPVTDAAVQIAYQEASKNTPGLIEKYRELAAGNPRDPLFHFLYGNITPDPRTARRCFLSAIVLDPDFKPAWAALHRTAVDAGDFNLAARAMERLAVIEPDAPEYLKRLAEAHFSARHDDLAVTAMASYLDHRPDDADAKNEYASMLLRAAKNKLESAKPDIAEELLKRALKYTPEAKDVMSLLADAALSRGRYNDALLWSERAGDRIRISRAFLAAGDPKRAREELKKLLDSSPGSAEAYFELGRISTREGNSAEAVEFLENAVQLDPVNLHYLFSLGKTAAAAGDDETARAAFSAFVSGAKYGSPDWKEAMSALIDIEKRLRKKADEALADVGKILEQIEADDSDTRHAALIKLNRTLGKNAYPLMAKNLKSKFTDVRVFAAASLGLYGNRAALEPLSEALGDTSPEVRREAALALKELGPGWAAEPLIRTLSDPDGAVRAAALAALQSAAGEDFGFKPERAPREQAESLAKWNNWLAESRKKIEPDKEGEK